VTIVAALAAGWLALLLLAPWLPVPVAGVVYLLGGRICHQIAERSWHLYGLQLPVCARCLGIYIGTAALLLAPRTPTSVRRVALVALALNGATIAIEWADLWHVSNAVRAGAGAALGVALALAIRQALGDSARGSGTVDYERCPSRRPITSALPESRI
jgi:uncharacterized membrane protein